MKKQYPPLSARGPLHVMFLTTSLPVGGAEVLLSQLVAGMKGDRFRTSITCLKERGELGDRLCHDYPVHERLIHHKYDLPVVGRLTRLFREQQVDALVTVGAGDKMFWGRLAAKRARLPVILSAIHSTGWPDQIGRANRMLTPITDGFIAVAESHSHHLVEQEGFPAKKVFVIPNGVDVQRFAPDPLARRAVRAELSIPSDAKCCGIVAALRPEKNHLMFLRVAAELKKSHPDSHFVLVGDGVERKKLELAAQQSSLAGRVHFLGTRQDTPRILAALDCFALTSHMEASPVSILEAMACELPVVATRVGSIHESVQDGVTGYTCQPGDVETMAARVRHLFDSESARQRMGRAGRTHVVNRASLEVMVDGYEELISRLYSQKAKSPLPLPPNPQPAFPVSLPTPSADSPACPSTGRQ